MRDPCPGRPGEGTRRPGRSPAGDRDLVPQPAVQVEVVPAVLAGAAGGAAQPTAAPGALKTATINGTTVLTNSRGLTLYWFAPDTSAMSKCYGSCSAYWPPVPGHATAGPGVTGKLGTIQRTGGTTQATYDGHPLYTYVGDKGPGQDGGNKIDLNGGLWRDVPVTGG